MFAPPGPKNWHIRAVTPNSEAIVSFPPPLMREQNVITHGSFISSNEVPVFTHYGSSRGVCPLMPSESVLHIISREEEEPENTVITSNSPALGDGMLSDATSLQRSGLDQHQILSRKVCLWIIHLHDNLEWIVNLAKAVVHITQQTYCKMNRAMCRLFLYLLITHWAEEVIKWVLVWRLVPLQLHNNPQHGVGNCVVTFNNSERICILQRASVRLLSLQLLFAAPGTSPVRGYSFRNDGHDLLEQLLKALL